MSYYLGLDSSTQSLSALAIDLESRRVVLSESLNFGQELPEYGSPQGFLPSSDAALRHANPLMWVAALERLLERVEASGFDFSRVRAVSGAGQQHGSVYLGRGIEAPSLDEPLVEQVEPLLSRKTSPIWMDSSTSVECGEIAAAAGGDERVVAVTGSRVIERFTGPQIRKFFKQDPAAYAATHEIHLVSSFMASLLAGRSAGIDLGDGAGMNLLELATGTYSRALLDATAPGLSKKLAPPVACPTRVGTVAGYFIEKFGFDKEVPVFAFTGDNPSSLIGMGASEPGTMVVSLGTSDTVFAAMREPFTDPRGYGHVFGNPAGGFMSLICFTNGSLAREAVAKDAGLDWRGFERAILEETVPGNEGNFMLPYFTPETTPRLLHPEARRFGSADFVQNERPELAARAIVEAQALSMKRHSDWIGVKPERILVTGGAAQNRGILQVLADVFQAKIQTLSVGNSSALGGALRAAQAATGKPWSELFAAFAAPDDVVLKPNPDAARAYEKLEPRFVAELSRLA